MLQGGGTLPAVSFTQRRGFLRPSSGLESIRRTFADVNVNDMRSHAGIAATVTLRQQQIDASGNNFNGTKALTPCAIAGQGQQHDNASRIKTLQEECAHYKSDNARLRQQAKQLELAKTHYHLLVLELQRRVEELEAELPQLQAEDLATSQPQNGNDFLSPELGTLSGANLAPSSDPFSNAASTVGMRKPHSPFAAEGPLRMESTAVHNSEKNIPRRHPAPTDLSSATKGRDKHPTNVTEHHEFACARSDTALNNALRTPFDEQIQRSHSRPGAATENAGEFVSDLKGNSEVESQEGDRTPKLLSENDSDSSTPQMGIPCPTISVVTPRMSADAATSRPPGPSLIDFWTGDGSHLAIGVIAEAAESAKDINMPVENGAAAQDKDSEGHPEELGQRALPLPYAKQSGDLDNPDNISRSSSDFSSLTEVYDERCTGMDVQDAGLPPGATSRDPVYAPIASKSTRSGAVAKMGEMTPPANCQAEEDVIADDRQKSTTGSSSAPKETVGEVTTALTIQRQPIPVLRPAGADAFNSTGASTHSMICSYCSTLPSKKDSVALCEGCPRRFCMECFGCDIQEAGLRSGDLDARTRALLEGGEGDIFVEECSWCIRKSDVKFAPPPEGVSWMKHLLQELLRHDLSHCFREPVDIEEHPDYLESIGRASMMDLGTMMSKFERQKYSPRRGPGQFVEDLKRIWRNCRKFTGCDELGQPAEGTHPPGIVRCALILEAMSRKFVKSHMPGKRVEWPETAWDFYSLKQQREFEEERLRRVERKENTSRRKPTTLDGVESGSNNLAPVVEGSKSDASEMKRGGGEQLGFEPSTNKRVRLETTGRSSDSEEGRSRCHSQSVPRKNWESSSISHSNASSASNAQQQVIIWKPLADLCCVASSFSR